MCRADFDRAMSPNSREGAVSALASSLRERELGLVAVDDARFCRLGSVWVVGVDARVAAALARAEVLLLKPESAGAHTRITKKAAREQSQRGGRAVALQKWAVFCRASCCEDGGEGARQ